MLSDQLIRQRLRQPQGHPSGRFDSHNDIVIHPYPEDAQIQPASLDLRLGVGFHVKREKASFANESFTSLRFDVGAEDLPASEEYTLVRGEFLLATTFEYIEMPDDLVARVEGKSSLGRQGLMVHVTAGFIDPGFKGNITLEMYNLSPMPFVLKAGMKICQLSFSRVEGRVLRPYGHPELGSKYQGQQGVTLSRAEKK